ncbi:MAG TPA: fibronectin type III domain-containing protein [Acidimicrobiales bacterium]
MRARVALALAAGVLVATVGAVAPDPPAARAVALGPVRPADLSDGVGWANYYRSFGENLAPVGAGTSAGPQNVANWLAAYHLQGDPYCNHVADANHPWPGGDMAHNVLFCGPPNLAQAITGWVDTPYHGAGFVDPKTTAISFGFNYDTSTALYTTTGASTLSRWPKPDGVLPSPAFDFGEAPDPRATCGYPVAPAALGRPLFITFPAAETFVGASVAGPGFNVPVCALHANPFEGGVMAPGVATRQIALITPAPYQRGQMYTADVETDNGSYVWSFLVADVPSTPAPVAGPSAPGQLTVAWAPVDPKGLPVTSYRVDNLTTGATATTLAPTATFSGLTPGVAYQFRVTATNDVGPSAPGDVTATAITVPAPPTFTAAVNQDGGGLVSWADDATAAAPILSYQIDVDGGVPLDVGALTAYQFSGLTNGQTYQVRVRAVNGAGVSDWSAPAQLTPSRHTQLFFGLVAPVRVADTRAAGGRLSAGTSRAFDVVAATGAAPAQVSAISMNLTATDADGPGYLTAWPCDQPRPDASNVNFNGGEPGVPNHVIVPVAADGTVCVLAGVSGADVILDVDGWFAAGAGLVPETPHRVLDTRGAGAAVIDAVAAVAPAGAVAAVLNVTAAGGSSDAGFVTVYPCGASLPLASSVNFGRNETVANAVVVPVAPDGTVCLHASTPVHLLVDVAGYVTANFAATGPSRVLDTRTGSGPTTGVDVEVAPAGAAGAVLNVTAAGGSVAPGYVTVHAADVPTPATSNLNFAAHQVVPNAAVVRPDGAGRVHLAASTPVQLVVDVAGFFL